MDNIRDHEYAVNAVYTPARVPRFKGNPLIEALPPSMDDDTLRKSLTHPLEFEPEERDWTSSERMQQVDGLGNFMMPLPQQVELMHALERMIRAGYTGRAPRTPTHTAITQRLYELQHTGAAFAQADVSHAVQISAALIGVSGMGKTTTLKRWCARIPKVIYHESINAYQVPWLHIELPSDGASIKGLATSIFEALERRIPGSNFVWLYTKGKPSEEMMILSAARLMHQYSVGMLICDEVQNLTNSPKGAQVLMTQLVSLCNVMEVPVLFVGTNKATRILGVDFRQARRSSGEGIPAWERLLPRERGGGGEWEDLVGTLWKYQWVKNPTPLTPAFSNFMFWGSQGVVDLAIKLFKSVQIRAMLDKSEKLSIELFDSVYNREFKVLHYMLDALRTNNYRLLQQFDDIRPLDFDKHLKKMQDKLETMKSATYATPPSDVSFKVRIASSLLALDVPAEQADAAAEYAAENCASKNLLEAQAIAADYLKAPKAVRKKSSKPAEGEDPKRFDERPLDYRRAYAHAAADMTTVREMLDRLAMAPEVEDLMVL